MKRPEESFHECVVREVSEELGLREGEDFSVAAEPLAHLEYTAWSRSANEETAYQIELFRVHLLSDRATQKVDIHPDNRWLTMREIAAHRLDNRKPASGGPEDGRPTDTASTHCLTAERLAVSPTMELVLSRMDHVKRE